MLLTKIKTTKIRPKDFFLTMIDGNGYIAFVSNDGGVYFLGWFYKDEKTMEFEFNCIISKFKMIASSSSPEANLISVYQLDRSDEDVFKKKKVPNWKLQIIPDEAV